MLIPEHQDPGSTLILASGSDGSAVKRTVLPNGIRVVSELVPGSRSVVIGAWVGVGSRDETPSAHGASHYLEHLLFKGTARRSAFEISAAIEDAGGDLNAFTSKEVTCFHARVLAADASMAVDVLVDMITSARLAAADFESERSVVLEELAMRDDEPADVALQAFSGAVYGSSPLARPIIGTADGLEAMRRSSITAHYRRHYRPDALVMAAAGAVDHGALVAAVRGSAGDWGGGVSRPPMPARASTRKERRIRPSAQQVVTSRQTEQAHVVLGMTAASRVDARRWPLAVLDVSLGGGMSSQLFQEVRERRGLAYAVGSFRAAHSDAGVLGVQAGTHPDRVRETIGVVRQVLAQAASDGLSEGDVNRAKGQLRGSSVLEAEDPGSRMYRLGEAEAITGEWMSVDEIIARIDAVDDESVAAVAADVLARPETLAVVGPFAADADFSERGIA